MKRLDRRAIKVAGLRAKSGHDGSLGRRFDLAPPSPGSLIESLRAFGYDIATAIADIVDNSVAAGAHWVRVDFYWSGSDSTISVIDDGCGMIEAQLVAAMRPGSQSPLAQRSSLDLGRFGLGLKTASFSQCRRLTVATRTRLSAPVARCWDLDHVIKVDDWQLLRVSDSDAAATLRGLGDLQHGTVVRWEKLDRVTHGQQTENERHQGRFLELAERVMEHLGMVFHEMIEGRQRLKLFVNGRPVVPWDPFMRNEAATQVMPETRLSFGGRIVKVRPFILPHHSKINPAVHERGGGPNGWNAHQGFYVYRNRRLLLAGDWLGFGWAKEEHYKLARIRLDLPNSLDSDWQIDVTKSRATPPAGIRSDLRRIAERARAEAKRVYSHRGAKIVPRGDRELVLLWHPIARHGKAYYKLNQAHPLVEQALSVSRDKAATKALLRLIEETVPYSHITIKATEDPTGLPAPFDGCATAQIRAIMEQVVRSLLAAGLTRERALHRLRLVYPFEHFPELIQAISEVEHG